MVAGLLFLAFAYFAVGQAAVNRNGAQTAADAAALAAAQKTRDQLAGEWLNDVLDPTKWDGIFHGDGAVNGCDRAAVLAEQNNATLGPCNQPEPLRYDVEVTTNKTVGQYIVPGTEDKRSVASATAVIDSLCELTQPGEGDALPQPECKGKPWDLNPDDLTDLPKPQDLFDVHLAD